MPQKRRDKQGRTRTTEHCPGWALAEIQRLRDDTDLLARERDQAIHERDAVAAVVLDAGQTAAQFSADMGEARRTVLSILDGQTRDL